MSLTLIIIPGAGASEYSFNEGATIADLVANQNLHGRDIIVNGTGIVPTNFATTPLIEGSEVFATGSVKGNGSTPANGPSKSGNKSGGGRGNNPSKR